MSEAKYTSLPVRTLGPARALTLEQHQQMQAYEPNSPSGGSRLTERIQSPDRWWERASCRADEWRGRTVWIEPHKHSRKEIAAAVAVCERCPVRAECAADDRGWCIQGGVAHVAKPAETQPRPKRQLICEWCAVQFTGQSRKFCSDACRRSHHRELQRKLERAHTPVRIIPTKAGKATRSDTTTEQACGMLGREEPGSLATTPSPSETSGTSGGPMATLNDLSAPVKSRGR